MERFAVIYYYYLLIGGAIGLIVYDAFAIDNDKTRSTTWVLLLNLIMLTFVYYQLFMRHKSESTVVEKIVLTMVLLVIIIGSIFVIVNTSILK